MTNPQTLLGKTGLSKYCPKSQVVPQITPNSMRNSNRPQSSFFSHSARVCGLVRRREVPSGESANTGETTVGQGGASIDEAASIPIGQRALNALLDSRLATRAFEIALYISNKSVHLLGTALSVLLGLLVRWGHRKNPCPCRRYNPAHRHGPEASPMGDRLVLE